VVLLYQDEGTADLQAAVQPSPLQIRPFRAGISAVCTAVGALVITIAVSLALIPLAVGVGALLVWLSVALILGWVAIELLAALERWFENDSRFQR
jgi:hypothetical protein